MEIRLIFFKEIVGVISLKRGLYTNGTVVFLLLLAHNVSTCAAV